MKLTEEIKVAIKQDRNLFIDIQKLIGTTEATMYRYIRDDKPRIIGMDVLNLIAEKTGRDITELTA